MIIAERKPIPEILDMVKDFQKIIVVGCKGCVTVCNAGGRKEVGILASILRLAREKEGRPLEVDEHTLERQCDPEYIEQLAGMVEGYDAVVSIACSIGPQYISGRFPEMMVFPGLNTNFLGGASEHGVWKEFCQACGNCKIHLFGGLCPIARCSKSILNGPCGGSNNGKCEVSNEIDCVWHLIVEKQMKQNKLKDLCLLRPIKDWSSSRDGGPRKVVREDLKL